MNFITLRSSVLMYEALKQHFVTKWSSLLPLVVEALSFPLTASPVCGARQLTCLILEKSDTLFNLMKHNPQVQHR